MDENGRLNITEVPYRPAAGVPPGAEVLDFAALPVRALGHGVDPYAPLRPTFHHLITVHSGTMGCCVDFVEYVVNEGTWLWVLPGQILQFLDDLTSTAGTVVIFEPGFLGRPTTAGVARPIGVDTLITPGAADADALQATLDLLTSEYRHLGALPLEVQTKVVRYLLSVLVLRLAHLGSNHGVPDPGSEVFGRFREAVELGFSRTHRVEDYAIDLSYNVRTISRATHAAAGRGAKQFIDERVLLEAKRLLVHTDLSATAIGDRLGFPGPTVFTRFFRRLTGYTPGEFRNRARAR